MSNGINGVTIQIDSGVELSDLIALKTILAKMMDGLKPRLRMEPCEFDALNRQYSSISLAMRDGSRLSLIEHDLMNGLTFLGLNLDVDYDVVSTSIDRLEVRDPILRHERDYKRYSMRLCSRHAEEFNHAERHSEPIQGYCMKFLCMEQWTHLVHIVPPYAECNWCGSRLPASTDGRPFWYCDDRCQKEQRAHVSDPDDKGLWQGSHESSQEEISKGGGPNL